MAYRKSARTEMLVNVPANRWTVIAELGIVPPAGDNPHPPFNRLSAIVRADHSADDQFIGATPTGETEPVSFRLLDSLDGETWTVRAAANERIVPGGFIEVGGNVLQPKIRVAAFCASPARLAITIFMFEDIQQPYIKTQAEVALACGNSCQVSCETTEETLP